MPALSGVPDKKHIHASQLHIDEIFNLAHELFVTQTAVSSFLPWAAPGSSYPQKASFQTSFAAAAATSPLSD